MNIGKFIFFKYSVSWTKLKNEHKHNWHILHQALAKKKFFLQHENFDPQLWGNLCAPRFSSVLIKYFIASTF